MEGTNMNGSTQINSSDDREIETLEDMDLVENADLEILERADSDSLVDLKEGEGEETETDLKIPARYRQIKPPGAQIAILNVKLSDLSDKTNANWQTAKVKKLKSTNPKTPQNQRTPIEAIAQHIGEFLTGKTDREVCVLVNKVTNQHWEILDGKPLIENAISSGQDRIRVVMFL